ncbi:glycosyltransferase family 1 protein [Sphingobacterium oryzagri]|uniref:Glycosyltransferase family 1 protein n=1 Tax=Sphingobacterium oryzagri TaxID=3025669 RepID=A0ABY7WH97_9SPHI|nr:glycosyltransferase family 1 protein [Sphingobacterium sp. KACC 22765]WDF68971.1 glycosyltransferase family 1 protein [Sphingobacterium sp. KACC 22765]
MLNKQPTGVGIYCKRLYNQFTKNEKDIGQCRFLFLKEGSLLSLKRYLWNFFVLPLKAYKSLIYSPSTHGSLFAHKQVITIHDVICLNFPAQHPLQYYYFKYYVPLLLKKCDKVIAISEFTKSEILKFYKVEESKVKVVYNGVERLNYHGETGFEEEVNILTHGNPFFLCVGASYSHKNIEMFIDAIALLDRKDVAFIIVGKDNEYVDSLKMLAKQKSLSNIIFLNYVSDKLLMSLYKLALANVYVSLYEGFGFPPMEAASFGTISIVADIPVMREVYGEGVLYVEKSNSAQLSGVLSDVLTKKYDPKPAVDHLQKLFDRYDWNRCYNEVLKTLKDVDAKK